jgi:hypothetical protein
MSKLLLGVLVANLMVAGAGPIARVTELLAVQSLHGHWQIVGVTFPCDGVQVLDSDDPKFVGSLTFTPARVSRRQP